MQVFRACAGDAARLPALLGFCAAGDVRVFEGHAFIVEAAVSLGGRDVAPGLNVFRQAWQGRCRPGGGD
jgi:hypothetical protein